MPNEQQQIILFDGVCNLCSASVQWIIRHDPGQYFVFASLQGSIGETYKLKYQIPHAVESVILISGEKVYFKSSAALRIAAKCSGAWKILAIFLVVPPFIRNAVYDFIARNRYRWFGKKEACWLPTPELKSRFLD